MAQCVHEMEEGTCSICLGLELRFPKIPSVEIRAAQLFDYATDHSEWTKQMACTDLGWSIHILEDTIRALRKVLAGDDINLVVNPTPTGWYYKLVGDLEGALPWATARLRSVESQLQTLADVAASICNATSAKTRDGKRARMIAAQMNILQLQLNNLNE